jgi:hypothetical protein
MAALDSMEDEAEPSVISLVQAEIILQTVEILELAHATLCHLCEVNMTSFRAYVLNAGPSMSCTRTTFGVCN